jgi:hypothetical protein
VPPSVAPLVSRFAEEFLTGEDIDIPWVEQRGNQMELANLFPVDLRWVQVREHSNGLDACFSEVRCMMQRLRTDTAVPNITVLSGTALGLSWRTRRLSMSASCPLGFRAT